MKARVELQRWAYTPTETLGEWRVEREDGAKFACLSLENPDRGNAPFVSCIPEGEYKLVRSTFHRGGYPCFEIVAKDGGPIPGRKLVKVHVGNTSRDVLGCVVLGLRPVTLRRRWGVGPSGGERGGFSAFMRFMEGIDEAPLTIYYRKG